MKKRIQFIWGDPNYDFNNQTGALDSILRSILKELSSQYDIYINQYHIDDLLVVTSDHDSSLNLSKPYPFSKFIPKSIKEYLRVGLKLVNLNKLYSKIELNPKPDLIFELSRLGSDLGVRLKEKHNVPLLVYFDAPAVDEYTVFHEREAPFKKLIEAKEASTIKKADNVIVYSSFVRDFLMRKSDIKQHAFSIYQTLDYSKLKYIKNSSRKENDPIVIGYVGSFSVWHNLDLLLDSFFKLRKLNFNVHLLLVGMGMEYERIKLKVVESEYSDFIVFTGFLIETELATQMTRIDIGVYPGSQWYNIPTKVFEYGSYGIASIAPRNKTIKEIFSNDEILFFNSDDEFYYQLLSLLSSNTLMESSGSKLFELIDSKYRLSAAGRFYNNVINILVKE